MAINAFTRKLERWEHLSKLDQATLETISGRVESVERHQQLIREGDDPRIVFLLLEGWAIRYKVLPNGKRQIVAILLPGDLCDIHVFILDHMDHGIAMLTEGNIVRIAKDAMLAVIDENPAIARALWWTTLVDEAVLREWLVNVGGRDAYARVAHLICELHVRMGNVGLVTDGEMRLPLTQTDMGEALGLTPVHVNRMLRQLRLNGLITFKSFRLDILDLDGLIDAAGFRPGYLHGKRPERTLGNARQHAIAGVKPVR
jgi:CRP-like cAMP-binding protein